MDWPLLGIALTQFTQSREQRVRIARWLETGAQGRPPLDPAAWHEALVESENIWPRLQARRGFVVTLKDEGYPDALRQIPDPPPVVLGCGDPHALQVRRCVAVVGSRRASASAVYVAEKLGRELAAAGITVVSGLARGVDAAAHLGALAANVDCCTVAVLGHGLDRIYPADHRGLAQRVTAQGALISEFAVDSPPRAAHFPQRNRIIAGLCVGALVIEASEHSGSLITARLSAEYGREVMVVPGLVTDARNVGGHRLIREGATLVRSLADVAEALGLTVVAAPAPLPSIPEADDDRRLLAVMDSEPQTLDEIAARAELAMTTVVAGLARLELRAFVHKSVHGYSRRPP